ncbi:MULTISPECIES: hypothetical protein [unclassified Lentimonas]|uniref:hypothetical protein n=2 Tax=Lentimonas TaxID=417293 RepID=UPI001A7E7FC2|nr:MULTISPECIES: hypothetical protein [unclassified Lentimonas]
MFKRYPSLSTKKNMIFNFPYSKVFYSICLVLCLCSASAGEALKSIETGHTIMKVRSASADGAPFIVASTYEGTVLGVRYDGSIGWSQPLSGYMNHDIWCEDLTNDGNDEILIANADGAIYCLSARGNILWEFKPNEGGHVPPMYAVCVIRDAKQIPYVVCGGFDKSFYYLLANGKVVKEVKSRDYSTIRPFGPGASHLPKVNVHTINFLRPVPQPDGSDVLAMHASNNHMQGRGAIYQFKPLADQPYMDSGKLQVPTVVGDFNVCDPDGDGAYEILLGTSWLGKDAMTIYDPKTAKVSSYNLKKIGSAGYRVTQSVTIPDGESFRYLMLSGNYLVTVAPDLSAKSERKINGKYAYNDVWQDATGRLLLASSQSGGSCIHILDTTQSGWQDAFVHLDPPGKIQAILKNTEEARQQLASFEKPAWEREPIPVYSTWAKKKGIAKDRLVQDLIEHYDSPVFLNSCSSNKENWDRSSMPSEIYRNKRDRRMKYVLTQQQVLDKLIPNYEDAPGIAYWVGHGNDPYMYQLETTKKVLDAANGKKTVLILPELSDTFGEAGYVIGDLFNPLAEYAAENNANIFFRSKNVFWQGDIYLPEWSNVVSGRFAKSVVPSMEETTDRTMELSLVGRMGLWASGAVDAWGMRCSRDNPSFDRSRQHSYQRLPNHFLRTMVFSLANGSSYMNNTYVDMDHMGLALELVAKGALFVPKREEIVSFSPVHLSMKTPDEHYLSNAVNHKVTTYYDRDFEEQNPFVFGRTNAVWPAAPNTEWDFSRYAAGVADRRQHFIPPYPRGTVLITPPQAGVFADLDAPRGQMVDHLHPLYRDIMQEFITDGRHYYSADGKQTYAADEYYQTVAAAIEQGKAQLPLTVAGDVAWVAAQSADNHLRLTLVDSGYLNPQARTALVQFHAVKPIKITDVLTGERLEMTNADSAAIDVPLGLFRLIDIEFTK